MPSVLLEGPFESDYSLAIVNRRLAKALERQGVMLRLHQRDNTTPYAPTEAFLRQEPDLAPLFVRNVSEHWVDIHSRYIYPPHADSFRARLHAVHCYGWEESVFPRRFVDWFNADVHLVTVMSAYVRDVLVNSGVRCAIAVVGLGVDHILEVPSKPIELSEMGTFDFLHVSSCFPRKGVDSLLEAFCQEFDRSDDVRLIIKTFRNPHNEVVRLVAEMDARYPRHAPIKVIWRSLDTGQMRHLYQHSGALVAPSRGEGFGLPAAEAMALGVPVIATVYSGHADICVAGSCWPIEYTMQAAQTHLTEANSVWAEPVIASIREQMRSLYTGSARERLERTERARLSVLDRYTWARVAKRHMDACGEVSRSRIGGVRVSSPPPKLGVLSTWNARCGIAEYSRYLTRSLPDGIDVTVFASRANGLVRQDEPSVLRCWERHRHNSIPRVAAMRQLTADIVASGVDAVSIQYSFDFLIPTELAIVARGLRDAKIATLITMHAVQHPMFPEMKEAFAYTDAVVCHRESDLMACRGIGAAHPVLFKHGVLGTQLDRPKPARRYDTFTISCFGFMLAPKGIYELIHAFALARKVNPRIRLQLVNSIYPLDLSVYYGRDCIDLIRRKRLGGCVSVTTEFLDDEQVLEALASSDLVVLPYLYSGESASGAGALAIASLTPVLCSDLPIFDELADVVHRFPSRDVFALATKLLELEADRAKLRQYVDKQADRVRELGWPGVAQEFAQLVTQLVRAHREK